MRSPERERLDAGIEELDLELSIDDRARLPDQLLETGFDDRAGTSFVHVPAVSGIGRLSAESHLESHGSGQPRRAENKA